MLLTGHCIFEAMKGRTGNHNRVLKGKTGAYEGTKNDVAGESSRVHKAPVKNNYL